MNVEDVGMKEFLNSRDCDCRGVVLELRESLNKEQYWQDGCDSEKNYVKDIPIRYQ